MNAPPKPVTIRELRERDGDDCWLCGGKLAFNASPKSRKAATKEHLVAQSIGGGDNEDNLVLCHRTCNEHLGNRPMVDKIIMREKNISNRAKQMARAAPARMAVATKSVSKADPVTRIPSKVCVAPPLHEEGAVDWQRVAMITIAFATFFAGLCLGMLVA